ncbi:hypothetical protein Q8F55_005371 [Vanrija albida]|uniref:Uncharacterized protein n=1 Tax=Vanrija albida TaxID=181172 RepID=A0ABR3Q2G5_9TREE
MPVNNVVNNLIRAAASVSSDISDADLDAHVAKLLAAEAKANDAKWSELGLGAFLGSGSSGRDSPDPSLPKPNKRFLASIIRNVDGHNTALLRQQAESARDARRAREPAASSSRRATPGSAASRLFGGALRSVGRDASRREDRGRGAGDGDEARDRRESGRGERRERERSRERSRERERDDRRRGDDRRRDRDDDRRRDRDDRRTRRDDSDDDRRRRRDDSDDDRRRRRDDSDDRRRRRDDSDDDRRGKRSSRRDGSDDERDRRRREDGGRRRDDDSERRRRRERDEDRRGKEKRRRDDSSSPPRRRRDRSDSPPRRTRRSPSASPPPPPDLSPPASPISRMDKYFKKSYDPALDVGEVPKAGLVTAVGWDNMLAVLKDRGKKRRKNSPRLSASPEPGPKARDEGSAWARQQRELARARPEEKGVMDMEYTARGGVREWDQGK